MVIPIFVCFCVLLLVFLQNLKCLSVSLVSPTLEDVGFCDNSRLLSDNLFCLFISFMKYLKKFVCVSFLSFSRCRRFL